jgi:hypothetical protein
MPHLGIILLHYYNLEWPRSTGLRIGMGAPSRGQVLKKSVSRQKSSRGYEAPLIFLLVCQGLSIVGKWLETHSRSASALVA